MHLFSSINDVLEYVGENGYEDAHRAEALDVQEILNHFEFIFVLHLMRKLLGITHDLSQVLQKKDQDIVNVMNLVKVAKTRLQVMREKGWEVLLTEVTKFCRTNEIDVLDMEDECVVRGRGRRKIEKIKNLHHYRVELFCSVIDMQAQELNHQKLLRLAKYYPSEFSEVTLYELESQLDNFIFYVRTDERFSKVSGIAGLAQNMVSTRKHENFPLVYLLIKLSLLLPVATASVERAFSVMKLVKTSLRNRMGDQLLNDCLVPYIENDVFVNVTNEAIMQRFQKMKSRR
ncbi:uncharacterized protein LOC121796509 [Salvia splendens]|uniref:uncharacterized protein LOC121796509 n=1 Tax=Salvia splendens TaxID=180675 RepID=UPI001C259C5D|nr:uncharacterized protein LOC121796509 [Salvia splendens]